jgi:diguanylate cyclase (GGDEF)-like protein
MKGDSLAPGKRAPMKRLIAIGFALTICFSAVCAYVVNDVGVRDYEQAQISSVNLVKTLAADITRNIEKIDLSLQAVADGLKLPEFERIDPALRNLILFDRSATASDMGSILALDRFGNVRVESRSLVPRSDNYAQKEYFLHHQNNADAALYISQPFFNALGVHVVGVSRRVAGINGAFDGVIVGVIKLSYFYDLLKSIHLGEGDSITIGRTDGTIVMRLPFDISMIGRNLSKSQLYTQLKSAPGGTFETLSTTDGVYRLFAYQKAGVLPLVVSVGHSLDSVYANWRRQAVTIGAVVAGLCLFNLALIGFLAHSLRRRADAERELAQLAMTDALTGLPNRRRFDHVIATEWNRMRRAERPLALLMIDADHFKQYNDHHGHQAGDKALAAIADCVRSATRRASETSARFGGEEFAIILPDETLEGAFAVAERIRANIQSLRAMQLSRADQIPTVSIGVASIVPQAGMTPGDLVRLADVALYQAKDRGRDCVAAGAAPLPPAKFAA